MTKPQQRLAQRWSGDFHHGSKKRDPWATDGNANKSWRPHAPNVGPVIFAVLFAAATWYLREHLRVVFHILADTSWYDFPPCTDVPRSRLAKTDAEVLVMLSYLVPFAGPIHAWAHLFKVPEALKERWRIITDTLVCNAFARDAPKVRFTPIHKLLQLVYRFRYALDVDIKAAFYHVRMHANLHKYFVVRIGEVFYSFVAGAMGYKNMVYVMQVILLVLLSVVDRSKVHTEAYIDNGQLLACKKGHLKKARSKLIKLAGAANVTWGSISTISTKSTYRGIEFDFRSKTVRISPKFVDKFATRFATVNEGTTFERWVSLTGMVVYGLQILQAPLGMCFHVFKWMATQTARRTHDSAYCVMWATARAEFKAAAALILANKPIRPRCNVSGSPPVLVCDACLTGVGGVLVLPDRGEVHLASGDWREMELPFLPARSINELEALAILFSLYLFERYLFPGGGIVIFTDNTAVEQSLRAMRSRSFQLNARIQEIVTFFAALSIVFDVFRVPTAANPADGLSRGEAFDAEDEKKLKALLEEVDGRRGEDDDAMFLPAQLTVCNAIDCSVCKIFTVC
jgi:hypothetical protein